MTIFGRFSTFGGLVGDFNKGHMSQICSGCGTVLSGLDIRNVKTDLKMLSLPVFWVENG